MSWIEDVLVCFVSFDYDDWLSRGLADLFALQWCNICRSSAFSRMGAGREESLHLSFASVVMNVFLPLTSGALLEIPASPLLPICRHLRRRLRPVSEHANQSSVFLQPVFVMEDGVAVRKNAGQDGETRVDERWAAGKGWWTPGFELGAIEPSSRLCADISACL